MNIPNFNALKPMSQFGPRQTMAQGYSSGVLKNAIEAAATVEEVKEVAW